MQLIVHPLVGLSAVVVVNELRSQAVHDRFTALFEQHFTMKRTPRSKMDPVHQHSAIDILILKPRKHKQGEENSQLDSQSHPGSHDITELHRAVPARSCPGTTSLA